ncbi:hypothetical protein Q9R19_00070 [Microbacterium sp. ARD32]|uniref:hypothetical protein n=1 Tax=Microbacterium sp. ARD32 TaxID=2962577 RepID=UPI002882B164|nr:hypothetical protein [Microbacterium sp. ARD32]MDT0156014.1 hypothetical protein [Microbacterium sp. ARD32]
MTVPALPAPPDPAAPVRQPAESPRSGLVIALAVVCAVLLLATIAFGGGALALSSAADAAPAPAPSASATPTPTPTAEPLPTVHGWPVSVVSDIEFRQFFLSEEDDRGFSALYADVRNPDQKQAATVFFDVSLYDEDGSLRGRWPASQYLLPGQESIFLSPLRQDLSQVASIRIEQVDLDLGAPITVGTVTTDKLRGGDGNLVVGDFTSTLDAPTDGADVFFVAIVDKEIVAACWAFAEIPANDTFDAHCRLEAASVTESDFDGTLPDDAKIATFFSLDVPL